MRTVILPGSSIALAANRQSGAMVVKWSIQCSYLCSTLLSCEPWRISGLKKCTEVCRRQSQLQCTARETGQPLIFCKVLFDKKLNISYLNGVSFIQSSLDTDIVGSSLVKTPSQQAPFEVQIFFRSLMPVEDFLLKKLVFVGPRHKADWVAHQHFCPACTDGMRLLYQADWDAVRAKHIATLDSAHKQYSHVQSNWKL